MTYVLATRRERAWVFILGLPIGTLLCVGFQPTAASFYAFLSVRAPSLAQTLGPYGEMAFFPLLSVLFWLSIPAPRFERDPDAGVWRSLPLALALGAAFGAVLDFPSVQWGEPQSRRAALWYIICCPVAEELLFRGWLVALVERVFPGRLFTLTQPLPLSIWTSAVAFSLWHLQNLGSEPVGFVLLQVAYTLVLGLWFGWQRWKSASIWPPIVSHAALNLSAAIV